MISRRAAVGLLLIVLCTACGRETETKGTHKLRIFHAAGLAPVLDALRDDCLRDLGIELLTEASGSQVACRKLAELGRECDLIMLADGGLVASLLAGHCSWRIDFANDEIVIGVGRRAPHISEAEEDWPSVLARDDVRLGRVDESQGPVGYRTLLVWRLQGALGSRGLYERLLKKCDKVVDHVTRLTPLLRNGEIDYAFVYRSICIAHDIRFIELDDRINLGSNDVDYASASVSYRTLRSGVPVTATVRGSPITWTLSIPDRGADVEPAKAFVLYLLMKRRDVLRKNGFRPIAGPRFYGPESAHAPYRILSFRMGDLK